MAPEVLDIRLLGPPQVAVGESSVRLDRKAAGLLAYLCLQGETDRARLAMLLWPDSAVAGTSLRQALFRIRRDAARDFVVGSKKLRIADGLRIDVLEAGDLPGELLEGHAFDECPDFSAWLQGERQRLEHRRVDAALAEIRALEAAGSLVEATGRAELAVRTAPAHEAAHRALIRLLYLRGERDAAIAAYERCALALHEHLAVEPDAETRALQAMLRQATALASVARPQVPVALLRPPRMVGRTSELAQMGRAWSEGQVFLVVGEPGLGKSRLLAEFAAAGDSVVLASARPGDATIAFATLGRLLRGVIQARPQCADGPWSNEVARIVPELAPRQPGGAFPPANALRLQRALCELLESAFKGGIAGAVVDDLHFADSASVEMLHGLAAAELASPRWGFAQRPAEGEGAVHLMRESLADAGVLAEVTLSPLDEAHVTELVDALAIPGLAGADVAGALHKATGGNPLFILEMLKQALTSGAAPHLLRAGNLPRPMNVGALIDRRLRQLSPPAMALARVAALAGTRFDAALAAHVLETHEIALADAWDELVAAQVLRDNAFAHDLVFEAMHRSVQPPVARQIHRRIAAYLEPREQEPGRVAEHWIAAGDAALAVPHLKAAAVKAEAAARFADARAHLERAIEVTSAAGLQDESFELQFLLVELLKDIGKPGEIAGVLAAMRDNATSADAQLRLARSECQALSYLGDLEGSERAARRALADPDILEEGSPRRIAEVRAALADVLLGLRRAPEALELLSLIEAPMREHPDPQYRGWFHSDYGRALLVSGRLEQASQQLDRALAIAREVGRQRMICGILSLQGQVASAAGLLNEPVERFEEALRAIADIDSSIMLTVLHMMQAGCLVNVGRYRDALHSIDIALSTGIQPEGRGGLWVAQAYRIRALAYAQLGQRRLADEDTARAEEAPVSPQAIPLQAVARIEVACLVDAPLGEAVARSTHEIANIESAFALSRLALAAQLAPGAAIDVAAMEALGATAMQQGMRGHAMAARLALARAAHRRGDTAALLEHGKAVLQALRRCTLPSAYRPWFWLQCYELLLRDDADLGRRSLQEAMSWISSVARYQVPDAFRASFMHDNPVNRALAAAAEKQGL